LNLAFHYPSAWGELKLTPHTGDTGTTKSISFASSNVVMGYTSTDFTAGREGTFYEMINISKRVEEIKDCDTYKAIQGTDSLVSCSNVVDGDTIKGIVLYFNFSDDMMLTGPYTVGYYFTSNANYPVVGLQVTENSATLMDYFDKVIRSFATPVVVY
jgi:hypothetical protein